MQEAFEKLKGVDIFALKAYLEKTSSVETSVVVAFNEIFVNFLFFILNLVVGFFSLLMRILEKINLYDNYKNYVYKAGQSIWQGFTGSTSDGLASQSLIGLLITVIAFYLFYQFFFSKGNFMRKVIHVCVVIILGFSYFGTIASTSGGLYLLDTIDNVSKTVTQKISHISVSYGDNKKLKIGDSIADSYIAETSYTAYLFVNTGQENGKYVNSQTGKEEKFDDSKVLGRFNGNTFTKVKNSDRKKYLDELGHNANEDGEKNRWVSAVYDYLFIKSFYVIFKIIEATVIAIPIILVQILNVIAQLLVLIMMLLFPIALLISFIPRMQDIIFGVLKVMMGGLAFPAITSLLTLIIFYLEKTIENMITSGFNNVIKGFASLMVFAVLFKLMVVVVAKALVYYFLWKYKGELIGIILGSRARLKMNGIEHSVKDNWNSSKEIIQQVPNKGFSTAQRLGNFALATSGLASGTVVNSISHLKNAKSHFSKAKPEEISPTNTEPHFEVQSPQINDYQDSTTPIQENVPESNKYMEEPKDMTQQEVFLNLNKHLEQPQEQPNPNSPIQKNIKMDTQTEEPKVVTRQETKTDLDSHSHPYSENQYPHEEKYPQSSIQEENYKANKQVKEPQLVEQEPKKPSSTNLEKEFETLKEKRRSPLTKRRIRVLEKRLEDYKDNESMYKAQGSNAFTKNFRKTLTRDDKLRTNLQRKERLSEELRRLRGE